MASTIQAAKEGSKAFPNSRKVYVAGSRPDLLVPAREIALAPSSVRGAEVANSPLRVYDTSGPYGDPAHLVDLERGLPTLRRGWVIERGDVEGYEGRGVEPAEDFPTPAGTVRFGPGAVAR